MFGNSNRRLTLFLLLISSLFPVQLYTQFSTLEPLPGNGTIWGHSSVLLNDTIYVSGGSSDGSPSCYFAKYSINGGVWQYSMSLPLPRSGGDMAVCRDRIYYIGGGSKSIDAAEKEVFVYDPETGEWKYETDIPMPVSGNSAECLNDSLIYSFYGGWNTYENIIQVYNINSRSWFFANPIPGTPGRRSFACGMEGNTIYICGGYSGGFSNDLWTGVVDGDNPGKITWSRRAPLAVNTSRPGGAAINGKFYVVTGELPGAVVNDSVAVWAEENNQWIYIDGKPAATSNLNNCVIGRQIRSNNAASIQLWFPGGSFRGETTRPLESLVISSSSEDHKTVDFTSSVLPTRFELYQNYPNPFNPVTVIKFDVPIDSYIRLNIYDITGKLVTELASGFYRSGTYELRFDAVNLSSGIFFCKFSGKDYEKTSKMMLIK